VELSVATFDPGAGILYIARQRLHASGPTRGTSGTLRGGRCVAFVLATELLSSATETTFCSADSEGLWVPTEGGYEYAIRRSVRCMGGGTACDV
jgi:hypothetical protein